ncbi:DMT family transporter [Paenibacillus assamensis]|uniref:DMT family transporter n=1 Tax=Paenibacillus assamensis TaxID=311244 RepID=UPI000420531D|nr:DMT family transporter [Paenibacillus assamensis]
MSASRLWKGALCCFIAAVAWGAMFPVAESALHHLDPFWFSTIRYVTVSVLLIFLLLWKEGRQAFRAEGRFFLLWMSGTFAFTVYNFGIFWGQKELGKSGVLLASIMESFMPMLAVLIVWAVTRKRPRMITLGCVIAAFIGVLFVVTKGDLGMFSSGEFKPIPLLAIFVAVVGWVIYTISCGQFKGWSALRISTLTCVYGSATSLVVVLILSAFDQIQAPAIHELTGVWPEMSFMIFIAGLLALLCWLKGIELLSPVNGMLFINFVPATTFIISIIQGYQVSAAEILGTVIITCALIVDNVASRRAESNSQATMQEKRSKTRRSNVAQQT